MAYTKLIMWLDVRSFLQIARLSICLFISVVLHCNCAKAQLITLNVKEQPLHTVLLKLRKLSNVGLLGDLSLLDRSKPVSFNVSNMSMEKLLKKISEEQPVDLIFFNGTIIVQKKEGYVESYVLTGRVTDTLGIPLSGVTVTAVDLSGRRHTTSGSDGDFKVFVRPDAKLSFSIVGYTPKSTDVNGKRALVSQLTPQVQVLEDVTINTGYNIKPQQTLTGDSFVITGKELERFSGASIFTIIQGYDPALKLDKSNIFGSNPNVLPEITVRGVSNIGEYAINQPLVILDGFEVPLERIYDLDINCIERVTLLKDASTMVLYGSRGGNGVLVVETRLPKKGDLLLTYETRLNMSFPYLQGFKLMDAEQKLAYETLAGLYDASLGLPTATGSKNQAELDQLYSKRLAKVKQGINTDWLHQPLENPFSLSHFFRMEAGKEKLRYNFNVFHNDAKGTMRESGRRRFGLGVNLIYRLNDRVTFRNYANLLSVKAYESPYGNFETYALMNPYDPVYDDNGNLMVNYPDQIKERVAFNPIYNSSLPFRDEEKKTVINNNFCLDWKIGPYVALKTNVVVERQIFRSEQYISPMNSKFAKIDDLDLKGEYNRLGGRGLVYQGNLNLSYSRKVGKHSLNGILVVEAQSSRQTVNTEIFKGFLDRGKNLPNLPLEDAASHIASSEREKDRLVGGLFSGNYIYDKKYTIEFSMRRDGSSRFGSNNYYANFWTLGAAYNLYNQDFLSRMNIQQLQFFINTGATGTKAFTSQMTETTYLANGLDKYYHSPLLLYDSEGNENLKWPQINSWNLGLRTKLWNERLSFMLSHYKRVTTRMISLVTTAPSVGLANNTYFENMGKAKNEGFEARISFKALTDRKNKVSWDLNLTAYSNRSVLTNVSASLKDLNQESFKTNEEGWYEQTNFYQENKSLLNIKGMVSLGIDPATGTEFFLDSKGRVTNVWNPDEMVVLGNLEPKVFGSLNHTFGFRNWNLLVMCDYRIGGQVYNQTLMERVESNNPLMNADVRAFEKRWKKAGDLAPFKDIRDRRLTQPTSRFVQSESYLNLSTLVVTYDLPGMLISRRNIKRMRISCMLSDFLRISTIDRERGLKYPFSKTITLGAMVGF